MDCTFNQEVIHGWWIVMFSRWQTMDKLVVCTLFFFECSLCISVLWPGFSHCNDLVNVCSCVMIHIIRIDLSYVHLISNAHSYTTCVHDASLLFIYFSYSVCNPSVPYWSSFFITEACCLMKIVQLIAYTFIIFEMFLLFVMKDN